jgi:hypothetical protein
MLPAVRNVEGVELIREGGSLAAKFESDGGYRYVLFVRIQHLVGGVPLPDRKLAHDHQPILIDCDPAKRPPNTATVLYGELGGPSISISWGQAQGLMATIAEYAERASPRHTELLLDMIDVVSRRGRPVDSPAGDRLC